MVRRRSAWTFSCIAAACLCASSPAGAQFGPVFATEDQPCHDINVGDLSDDGRHLAISRWCSDSIARGIILRDFMDRVPIRAEDILPEEQDPRFTILGFSGDGRVGLGSRDPIPGDATDFVIQAATLELGSPLRSLGFLTPPAPMTDSHVSWVADGSLDGSVLVGSATGSSGSNMAVRWTAADGFEAIGPETELGANAPPSSAWSVSSDGTVVGVNSGSRGFRWTRASGLLPLEVNGGDGGRFRSVIDVSSDGSMMLGEGWLDHDYQLLLWHAPGTIQGLGSDAQGLAGPVSGLFKVARALSGNGKVAVGGRPMFSEDIFSDDHAFIWTHESGLVSLRIYLESIGIRTNEWATLSSAFALDETGETLLGTGYRYGHSSFDSELFYAKLIPPSDGIDLCDRKNDLGCVGVEVIAQTGGVAPTKSHVYPATHDVFASFGRPILGETGLIAFEVSTHDAARVAPPEPPPGRLLAPYPVIVTADRDAPPALRFHEHTPIEGFDTRPRMRRNGDVQLSMDRSGALYFTGYLELGQAVLRSLPEEEGGTSVVLRTIFPRQSPQIPQDLRGTSLRSFRVDGVGRVSSYLSLYEPSLLYGTGLLEVAPDGTRDIVFQHDDAARLGLDDSSFLDGLVDHTRADGGRVAFAANIKGPQDDPATAGALWATTKRGGLHQIFRDGDPVTTPEGPLIFGPAGPHAGTREPTVSAKGVVFFRAPLVDPRSDTHAGVGLFRSNGPGRLDLLLRERELEAALPTGSTNIDMLEPLANARGDLLIQALFQATPPNPVRNIGYWIRTSRGKLQPLLQTGQPAPGLPAGTLLGGPNTLRSDIDSPTRRIALNDRGDALVDFPLTGVGVDESNDRALFLVDLKGRSRLVLREGAKIEVAHNDLRIVDHYTIQWQRPSSRSRSPLNRDREVAARVSFTDESSAIVRLTVPRVR